LRGRTKLLRERCRCWGQSGRWQRSVRVTTAPRLGVATVGMLEFPATPLRHRRRRVRAGRWADRSGAVTTLATPWATPSRRLDNPWLVERSNKGAHYCCGACRLWAHGPPRARGSAMDSMRRPSVQEHVATVRRPVVPTRSAWVWETEADRRAEHARRRSDAPRGQPSHAQELLREASVFAVRSWGLL
jgi:hypothetical protein